MERTCIKCGNKNAEATGDMDEACPGCGAIYTLALQERLRANVRRMPSRAARDDEAPSRSALSWLGGVGEVLAWVATAAGGVMGGYQLSNGLEAATSAPQQAAVAGMAVAYAVIPYCVARAIQHLRRGDF